MDKLSKYNTHFSANDDTLFSVEKELQYVDIKSISEVNRRNVRVSSNSMYGDDVWDMSSEFPRIRSRQVVLKFKKVKFNDGSILTDKVNRTYLKQVKEYYYTLYTNPTSIQSKWSSYIASIKSGVQSLCRFMKENCISYFDEINEHDFEDFLEGIANQPHHLGKPITDRTLHSRVKGLALLYEQSPKMKRGLKFDPYANFGSESTWSKKAAQKVVPSVGMTKEIPDEVLKKLLSCALNEIRDLERIKSLGQFFSDWYHLKDSLQKMSYRKCNPINYVEDCHNFREAQAYANRIESACYIVIALLTGMRIHEVSYIAPDIEDSWKEILINIDGLYKKVHFVLTTTKKLEPEPKDDQWQAIPIVKDALIAMKLLNINWINKGSKYLFCQRTMSGSIGQAITHVETNIKLKNFVSTNEIYSDSGVELWSLTSHQFRKTHARIMIRQGLGLKELQDQLKHYDVEMTKIYGDMNLYTQLQKEKFKLSADLYEEFIGNQVPIIGGGAEEVDTIRKQFMGIAKKDRKDFLNLLPRKALIEQTDDGLCMYRSEKALCGGNKNNCLPSLCGNSIINAKENKRSIEFKLKENERMILFFNKDSFKSAHLKKRNVELISLVRQLEDKNV